MAYQIQVVKVCDYINKSFIVNRQLYSIFSKTQQLKTNNIKNHKHYTFHCKQLPICDDKLMWREVQWNRCFLLNRKFPLMNLD